MNVSLINSWITLRKDAQTNSLWYRKTTGDQQFPMVQKKTVYGIGRPQETNSFLWYRRKQSMVSEDHRRPTVSYGTEENSLWYRKTTG